MSHSTNTNRKRRSGIYTQGYLVGLALAVLTAVEWVAAVQLGWASLLFFLAILKAYLVLNYFMHVKSLWAPEEEH